MSTTDRTQPGIDRPDQLDLPDKPEGPVVAAILAGGFGSFVMGLLTTLSEASTSIADALKWDNDVGPLSGKTSLTVIVWLMSWAILHALYRRRQVETRGALTVALVLVGLGVLLTFPTFFQLFAPD